MPTRFASDEPAARVIRQQQMQARYQAAQVWKPAPKDTTYLRRVQAVAEVNTRAGIVIKTTSDYVPVPKQILSGNAKSIVLSSVAFDVAGSFAPSIDDEAMRYIAGYDNFTIYYDGQFESRRLIKRRADGYKEALPPGFLRVTGLPPGAAGATGPTYYLYPFWIPGTCFVGWVPGNVGTPRFCHLAQTIEAIHQQNYRGREALSDGALSVQLASFVPPAPVEPPAPPPVNGGIATLSLQVQYPGQGTNTSTSFNVRASASDTTYVVSGWFIYRNDVAIWSTDGPTNSIDAPISVPAGGSKITVRVWNSHGDFTSLDMQINASPPVVNVPPPIVNPSPGVPYNPCVMLGTEIIPIGDGIYSTEQMPQAEWSRLFTDSGRELIAVPTHRIMTGRAGWTEMRDVRKGDKIMTEVGEEVVTDIRLFTRPGFKVCVHMSKGHTYWANGVLSHNVKIHTT